jgi:Pentapeptide repeats (9 copies)
MTRDLDERRVGGTSANPVPDKPKLKWPILLSDAGILGSTIVIAGIGVTAVVIMLSIAGNAPYSARAGLQIDAVKYGAGFFAASGAVAALLLGVRRQRLSERSHELALEAQRLSELNHELAIRAQLHNERDAAERRVTELYAKAVEQLGSPDAAVRLGGLYSLERVAQGNPDQRQTIVNIICAYLRMPYNPSQALSTAVDSEGPSRSMAQNADHELQVRLTAQRIVVSHLVKQGEVDGLMRREEPLESDLTATFWSHIDIDLSGATLIEWNLSHGSLRNADFSRCLFIGCASFSSMRVSGDARFSGARFSDGALFKCADFEGVADFMYAAYVGEATFSDSRFCGIAWFGGAEFDGVARFESTHLLGGVSFGEATFKDKCYFTKAVFRRHATFIKATFVGDASFGEGEFESEPAFGGSKFLGRLDLPIGVDSHGAT